MSQDLVIDEGPKLSPSISKKVEQCSLEEEKSTKQKLMDMLKSKPVEDEQEDQNWQPSTEEIQRYTDLYSVRQEEDEDGNSSSDPEIDEFQETLAERHSQESIEEDPNKMDQTHTRHQKQDQNRVRRTRLRQLLKSVKVFQLEKSAFINFENCDLDPDFNLVLEISDTFSAATWKPFSTVPEEFGKRFSKCPLSRRSNMSNYQSRNCRTFSPFCGFCTREQW